MYNKILVPHDGSQFAEQVLPYASEIARRFEAEVHLLEVIETPNPAIYASELEEGLAAPTTLEAIDEALDAARATGRDRLQALTQQLRFIICIKLF